MAGTGKRPGPKGPIERLCVNVFCFDPNPDLTEGQKFALHQFFHTVLAAGYALYQVVGPELADPVIEEKFRCALAKLD